MTRTCIKLEAIEPGGAPVTEPTRFEFLGPLSGGPSVGAVRAALAPRGLLRLSVSGDALYADVDPGPPETPLVALDMIVRSDAAGLRRVVESALLEVDEVAIGVDGRSDAETVRVAEAYADKVWRFEAKDIGLSADDWTANRIHFANARNLGRAKVSAPWALFLDSDEFLQPEGKPLRDWIRAAPPPVGAFGLRVDMGDMNHMDVQRLARTAYQWMNQTHNTLLFDEFAMQTDRVIVHDTSLRSAEETARRLAQRNDGVENLVGEAEKGHVGALFHLAKHYTYTPERLEDAVKYAIEYRARTEPHGLLAADRAHLAALLAMRFYEKADLVRANLWAVRSLLDGPTIEAFCMLGDIAETYSDLRAALIWYEAACLTPVEEARIQISGAAKVRWGRRDGLRRVIAGEKDVPQIEVPVAEVP